MSNLKSSFETFLRQMKKIPEGRDVESMTFGTVANTELVKDWTDRQTIPVQLVLKKQGVNVITYGKEGEKL